jgi:hypothetical protein
MEGAMSRAALRIGWDLHVGPITAALHG